MEGVRAGKRDRIMLTKGLIDKPCWLVKNLVSLSIRLAFLSCGL